MGTLFSPSNTKQQNLVTVPWNHRNDRKIRPNGLLFMLHFCWMEFQKHIAMWDIATFPAQKQCCC